eukprot:1818659-Lingulodinium_polyedra.AAC.1
MDVARRLQRLPLQVIGCRHPSTRGRTSSASCRAASRGVPAACSCPTSPPARRANSSGRWLIGARPLGPWDCGPAE